MVPQNGKHSATTCASHLTSSHVPKRNESTCPPKNLYTSVCKTIIHNIQKVETTLKSIHCQMGA